MTRYSMQFKPIIETSGNGLTDEQKKTLLNQQFDNEVDPDLVEGIINTISNHSSKNIIFSEVPEEEKAIRAARTSLMREKFTNYSINSMKYQKRVPEFGEKYREYMAAMTPDKEKNEKFIATIGGTDKEAQHELFMDLMDRVANVDVDKIMNYSDQEFADHFEEFFEDSLLTMELEGLLKDFKNMNCGVTPEEEECCNKIIQQTSQLGMHCYNRIDVMCNSYYQDIDLSKMEKFNNDIEATITNINDVMDNVNLSDYMVPGFTLSNQKNTTVSGQIETMLLKAGENAKKGTFDLAPEPERKEFKSSNKKYNYTRGMDGTKKLEKGETVYAIAYNMTGPDLLTKEYSKNIHAFRMNKQGVVYEVPVAKKPGLGIRMLDGIMRFFGSKEGRPECREYERQLQEINRLDEEYANKSATSELAGLKKDIQYLREQKALKAQAEVNERSEALEKVQKAIATIDNKKISANEVLHTMYGPNAGGPNDLLRRNAYAEKDYKPDSLPAPENNVFNERETDLIYMCGVSSPKHFETYEKSIKGLSNEQNMKRSFQNAVTDLLVVQRSKVLSAIDLLNPGRQYGQECLQKYLNGDKKPLAEILGNTVKSQLADITAKDDINTNETVEEMRYCMDVLNIIGKDEELLKNSGLSENDINKAHSLDAFTKSYENSLKAKEKLLKESLGTETFASKEEREEALLTVATHEVLYEAELRSINEAQNSEEFVKLCQENVMGITKHAKCESQLRTAEAKNADPAEIENLSAKVKEAHDEVETVSQQAREVMSSRSLSNMTRYISCPPNPEGNMERLKETIRNSPVFKKVAEGNPKQIANAVTGKSLGKNLLPDVAKNLPKANGFVANEEKVNAMDRNKSVEKVEEKQNSQSEVHF